MNTLIELLHDWIIQCPDCAMRKTTIWMNEEERHFKMAQEPKKQPEHHTAVSLQFNYAMSWVQIERDTALSHDFPGYLKFVIQKAAFDIDRRYKEWKDTIYESGQARTSEAASGSESGPDQRQGPSPG